MQRNKRLMVAALGLVCLGLTACSTVKAWTAPTWVYTNAQGRLEMLNSNAGSKFCLTRGGETTCGVYSNNPDVFASAMAHFKRQQNEVVKPEKPSDVVFSPDQGADWTWSVQPDGSFKDDKNEVWALVEFRQLGRTHTE
jgi:hypothetical protein